MQLVRGLLILVGLFAGLGATWEVLVVTITALDIPRILPGASAIQATELYAEGAYQVLILIALLLILGLCMLGYNRVTPVASPAPDTAGE